MLVGRRFVIAGRVQGVGYRFFTRTAAQREGLSGTVQNLDDGRVEVVVEGERDAVDRFERALRQGPPGSRVHDVQIDIEPPTGQFRGFHVLP
jgi:acylphosphatase